MKNDRPSAASASGISSGSAAPSTMSLIVSTGMSSSPWSSIREPSSARKSGATVSDGQPVYLKDIWPSNHEIAQTVHSAVTAAGFRASYEHVFDGDARWQSVQAPEGALYSWDDQSTYVQNPPYFAGMTMNLRQISDVKGARAGAARRFDHHRPHLAGR